MKKKNLKSFTLNKKFIASFHRSSKGGAVMTWDILCQTAPTPGPDTNHTCYFSCPGNDMPSCNWSDCC
ncbi:hypothetical protein [Kordia zhangzhouensis]|uniref:hypothetical protein n=1 Tax=Kordia zhangzhouensis TaxID=1620405 RepID=UPI0012DFEA24|nr:hypothetical protein [Kordia zhangzhouensis]